MRQATIAFAATQRIGAEDALWRILDPGTQALTTRETFASFEQYIVEEFGVLLALEATQVTPYPQNGVVAVDFTAAYSNDYYACGYLIVGRADTDQGVVLVRVERNFLAATLVHDPQAEGLLAQPGCVARTASGFDVQVP